MILEYPIEPGRKCPKLAEDTSKMGKTQLERALNGQIWYMVKKQ